MPLLEEEANKRMLGGIPTQKFGEGDKGLSSKEAGELYLIKMDKQQEKQEPEPVDIARAWCPKCFSEWQYFVYYHVNDKRFRLMCNDCGEVHDFYLEGEQ